MNKYVKILLLWRAFVGKRLIAQPSLSPCFEIDCFRLRRSLWRIILNPAARAAAHIDRATLRKIARWVSLLLPKCVRRIQDVTYILDHGLAFSQSLIGKQNLLTANNKQLNCNPNLSIAVVTCLLVVTITICVVFSLW